MTIQLAYQQLVAQLYDIYDTREAANIANLVIEHVTGQPKIERLLYRDLPVTEAQQTRLQEITHQLLNHRPIQYALSEAWFMEQKFAVNENVLIPRPETEELVQWIINDCKKEEKKDLSLLDVGTGSGCIAISLKNKLPTATVTALDISTEALQVARMNSIQLNALVDFLPLNFLDMNAWKQLGKYDVVVSNPPYILQKEQETMRDNVTKYEPPLALFVPNDDGLLFYRALAKFGNTHLNAGGSMYVEINEKLGEEVVVLFRNEGYGMVTLRKDMQGKHRMVKATL